MLGRAKHAAAFKQAGDIVPWRCPLWLISCGNSGIVVGHRSHLNAILGTPKVLDFEALSLVYWLSEVIWGTCRSNKVSFISIVILSLMPWLPVAENSEPSMTYEGISEAIYDLMLGFEIDGRVSEVVVTPGQRVEAGESLIRLDDSLARSNAELLAIRADSTFEVDSAKAEWELAEVELERAEFAFAQQAGLDLEVRRAKLQAERERLAFELFRQRRQEADLQRQRAEIELEQYSLRAPRAGVVEEITVDEGELVRQTTPILRLVDTSTIRIEVPVPEDVADTLDPDDPVKVYFPGDPDKPNAGRVVRVRLVGDPASGTRVVTVEMTNPNGFAAGSMVRVGFD